MKTGMKPAASVYLKCVHWSSSSSVSWNSTEMSADISRYKVLLLRQSEYFLGQGQSQAALMHLEEARAQEPESTQVIFHLHLQVNKRIKSFNGLTSLSSPTTGVSGKGFLAPGNGKKNWKSHSRFTGRERERLNSRFDLFSCLDQPSAKLQIMRVFSVLIPGQNFLFLGTGREITKCHGNLRHFCP